MRSRQNSIAKGIMAGMLGGFAGSLTMNWFQTGIQKVRESRQKTDSKQRNEEAAQEAQQSSEEDDATVKTADRISMLVTHHHLNKEQKAKAGPVVHYAYGTLLGAVYGAMSEMSPLATKGAGAVYASAVWLLGDEFAVPKLGLAGPREYPLSSHLSALASHLVYGTTTEMVRRGLRAII